MPRKKKDSDTLEVKFEVTYEYNVKFTRDVFGDGNETLAEALGAGADSPVRVMLVAERAVVEQTPELGRKIGKYFKEHNIALAGRAFVVGGGEINKTNGMTTVRQITEAAANAALDKRDFILVIGGGAMLDAAGFAAASLNRGLRIVRMPSTLLAQSEGASYPAVATNILNRKDASGVFAAPFASIVDFDFLKTLSESQRREGLAEAVKIAAVKDVKFLNWINKNAEKLSAGDAAAQEELVRRSAALHVETLLKSKDPFGPAAERVLEFGHWCAHRIEALGRFRVSHGAALAIGLCVDTAYAVAMKLVPEEDADLVGETLARTGALAGIEQNAAVLERADDLISGIEEFRLHTGGLPVFPGPLGKVAEVESVDAGKMKEIILELRKTCGEIEKLEADRA